MKEHSAEAIPMSPLNITLYKTDEASAEHKPAILIRTATILQRHPVFLSKF